MPRKKQVKPTVKSVVKDFGIKPSIEQKITIKDGGLGTDMANIFEKSGLKKLVEIFTDGKDCGCADREKKLNEILPKTVTARCFTEAEYKDYAEFQKRKSIVMPWADVLYICELYHNIFQLKGNVYYHCAGCSPKPIIKRIDLLDKVFETYGK